MLNQHQSMFTEEPSHGLQFIILIIVSFCLMAIDHNVISFKPMRSKITHLVYPLQWMVNAPIVWQSKMQRYWLGYQTLITENEHFTKQQLRLNAKILKLEALQLENQQLKELLSSVSYDQEHYQFAQIIQVDPNPLSHMVLINKGEQDKVYIGQPLIDAYGVMGKVIKLNQFTSQVMLLSHQSHGIPVENLRNGLRAIAIGNHSQKTLELQHVPLTSQFKVGDQLISSGLSGGFPAGYPVGNIQSIQILPGNVFAKIVVKPNAKLYQSRHVLLIKPKAKLN